LALVEAAWLAGDDALVLERLRAARKSEAVMRFTRSGGELALWRRWRRCPATIAPRARR
jgi:hypothetical protein